MSAPDYTLAAHPRARRHIVQARALAALVALGLVTYLGHHAGTPFADALERGLLAAVATYLVAWVVAVAVWHHLAQAELELARRRLLARAEELAAERAGTRREADAA